MAQSGGRIVGFHDDDGAAVFQKWVKFGQKGLYVLQVHQQEGQVDHIETVCLLFFHQTAQPQRKTGLFHVEVVEGEGFISVALLGLLCQFGVVLQSDQSGYGPVGEPFYGFLTVITADVQHAKPLAPGEEPGEDGVLVTAQQTVLDLQPLYFFLILKDELVVHVGTP